jgi:hypothetical protein
MKGSIVALSVIGLVAAYDTTSLPSCAVSRILVDRAA